MPTNRELASAILILVAVTWVLAYPKTRRALWPVVRAAFAPRLLVVWIGYLAYSGLIYWAAFAVGAWTETMTKDAALLVLGVGFPMVFSANTVKDGRRFVRQVLLKTVGVSAMVAAYLQLAFFSLPAELLLQVIVTVLVLMETVAQRTPGSEAAAKLCGWILVTIGLAYFWHTTVYLLTSSDSVDWPVTWRVLGMAIWFPVALMPFTYLLAFAMACGLILTHLRIHNAMRRPPRQVRLAVVVGLHLSTRLAHGFAVRYRYDVARATSFREANAVMREYRKSERSPRPDDEHLPA